MKLFKLNFEQQSKMGNWIVRTIPIAFIAFSIWVTLTLISDGNYYSATGWGIISTVIIFFLVLSFIKPREYKAPDIRTHRRDGAAFIHDGDAFALLYSSKDIVRISQIEQALRTRGIDCTVLDRHGSSLMSFVPGIEMRIIVPQKDLEWSVKILNEVLE